MDGRDDGPPTSWRHWGVVHDNTAPSYEKLRLEFTAAEENPLPPTVDERESKVYIVTKENLVGSKTLDGDTGKLVQEYNNIAFNRRDIIRQLIRVGQPGKGKQVPKNILTEIRAVVRATESVRTAYRDLRRRGGKPPLFPDIFEAPIEAPSLV
ncbi:hypothetical protein EJB05_27610 [Eragrostis curvula]|uniref:Uncharacterized protein n=1 Tax=Eragrostis curvula TaxID=38414 RepID=A0A5J9UMS2_9POAL|nr:hypothetical protein EJB05_27610 [Eragrostis curvula]